MGNYIMKAELQNKLFEKYPKIFKQKDDSMRETCMCWGIDCDAGWYALLDCLCHHIQYRVDKGEEGYIRYPFGMFFGKLFGCTWMVGRRTNKKIQQVEAIQVKEKFGGLRFYYYGGNKEIDTMIHMIESMSYCTCETCGSTRDVSQTKGWIYTWCKDCQSKATKRGKI